MLSDNLLGHPFQPLTFPKRGSLLPKHKTNETTSCEQTKLFTLRNKITCSPLLFCADNNKSMWKWKWDTIKEASIQLLSSFCLV